MQFLILLLHVLVSVSLIALVLVQHGKGADIGAAFGAGASQTVFGSSGASSFLMKLTGSLAAVFFATSIFLGHLDAESMQQTKMQLPATSKTNPIVIPGEKNMRTLKSTVPARRNTEKK
jgi:preprotein translocase subunit SecG